VHNGTDQEEKCFKTLCGDTAIEIVGLEIGESPISSRVEAVVDSTMGDGACDNVDFGLSAFEGLIPDAHSLCLHQ
jgi:hypothetical protein